MDGSIQLVGRAIFVNEFFNLNKVTEMFGELSKIKEKEGEDDFRGVDREDETKTKTNTNTFMLPFYITRPSLLTFKFPETENQSTKNIKSFFLFIFFCSEN